MKELIIPVLVVGGLGLFFGLLLAFASMVFAVKQDERIDKITEALPGANCGACGFAGCSAYASAIVNDGAPVNVCPVGKQPVAEKIAEIMGVNAGDIEFKVAYVKCNGTCENTVPKYEYVGIHDCVAMSKLAGGHKHCRNACIGFGSCVNVCNFDAISVQNGVAAVDPDKCSGCGACAEICPHNTIEIIPADTKIIVTCTNVEKAQSANRHCKASCIGCKLCEKVCEADAIHVENNCAKIDYTKCTACGKCVEKCPKKVIKIR
ncbi:MAG: RnfABCDGE type electron transport complex subunit B [Clostridia bacterium]|nr:RnfABCDGE type electron transport complex subunit B [Clostridia bacterium]